MCRGLWWALAAALVSSCLVDSANLCGPNQKYDDIRSTGCVCVPGSVPKEQGCVPCLANEVVKGANCDCSPGHSRNPASKLCEADTISRCSPACSGEKTRCISTTDGGGYCTSDGCVSNAGCASGETCATWDSSPYCMRSPTGLGQLCASSPCTGLDADYCAPAAEMSACVVSGCDVKKNDCSVGNKCCDLSAVGLNAQLCIPPEKCPQ